MFFCFSLFAQEDSKDFELTWSSPKAYKSALHFVGAKKTENGYLIFDKETIKGPGGYRYFIEYYNNDMVFEKRIDISEQVDEKNYVILDVLNYGDNFLLITSRVFKKEKREEIYLQKIGEEGEQAIGERVKIHEEEYYRKKSKSTYRLSVSPNDNFLLVQVIPSWRRKHEQRLTLILLDSDLNIHWSEENVAIEGESESSKEKFAIVNIIIDDLEGVYFLGRNYITRLPFRFLESGDRTGFYNNDENPYQIFKLVEGKFTGETITLGRNGLVGMDIQLGKDNTLHCVGYFIEEAKNKSPEGVTSYTIESDLKEITSENFVKFDDDFHLFGLKGRALNRAQKRIDNDKEIGGNFNNLTTEKILQQADGSITLIGEVQYAYTYTSGFGENATTRTRYVYGDLVISHISPKGEIISNAMIRKNQVYGTPTPVHNLMFPANQSFNRIELKSRGDFLDPDPEKNKKDRLLAVRVVNKEGEHSEDILFDYTDKPEHRGDRIPNIARNGVVLKNNDVIILSQHSKREYKFIRIRSLLEN